MLIAPEPGVDSVLQLQHHQTQKHKTYHHRLQRRVKNVTWVKLLIAATTLFNATTTQVTANRIPTTTLNTLSFCRFLYLHQGGSGGGGGGEEKSLIIAGGGGVGGNDTSSITNITTTTTTTTAGIIPGYSSSSDGGGMGISGGGVVAAAAVTTVEGGSSNVTSNATTTSAENHFNSTSEMPQIPSYIRTTSMFLCISIMILGVIGNVMVPIVILKTKDMRNSTNIFLTNLSIADLLVLLVCTPTVLVEVNTRPETWVLGQEMCKAVPFVELTVAHASVLTILAISFERYYAICEPLKAGYVCTKTRALLICVFAWGVAALFTSPILWVAEYKFVEYIDGSFVAVCLTQAVTSWTIGFFLMTISIFFIIPLAILIVLYGIIAKNLISKDGPMMKIRPTKPEFSYKARKQVVLMLGAVVLSFFLCLLPFRVLTLWIILSSDQAVFSVGVERYYNLLYFSRIMLYLNSAINPILYNLMSTKFRKGFLKLCICCKPFAQTFQFRHRTTTLNNTNTTSSSFLSRSSNRRPSDDLKNRVGGSLKNDLQQKEYEVGMLSKCDSSMVIDECRKLSLANNRRKLSSVDNEDEEEEVIEVGVEVAAVGKEMTTEIPISNDNSNLKDHQDEAKGKLINCRKKCKRQISFDENVIVNSERGVNGERIVYQTSLEDKICGSGKKDTSVINFLSLSSPRNSLQK